MQYTFTVYGQPHGKGRPRFSRYGNHVYTDRKTHEFESFVMLSFLEKYPYHELIETAVSVMIAAYFSIPKNTSKRKRELMESGQILPTGKSDVDNIAKAVLDGLNRICWVDDRLVTDLMIQKRYSSKPRLEITISSLAGRSTDESL